MSLKVIAKDPDGREQTYEYDPINPLGSGHTGVVYRGWLEGKPDEMVAIKQSRSADTSDMDREMEIVGLLYAPNEQGGNAVPWAARGRNADGVSATPYIVMELIDGENLLSRRLAANVDAKVEEAGRPVKLLRKEQNAIVAGLQYAKLLVRMAKKGVISRGDRKATDFRLLGGNGQRPRLVVLDWNRAEVIDIDKLRAAKRGDAFIRQREHDLAQGKVADIRIFARWWAEFVLGRSDVRTLRELENAQDDSWMALSRGYRDILMAAEAAGNPHGYQTAEELESALNRHLNNLQKETPALLAELEEMSRTARATPQFMEWLVDLAARRGVPDEVLDPFRRAAERLGNEALALAKRTLAELKIGDIFNREWAAARAKIANARGEIGPITPETAAAHLLLLRWDMAASAADAAAGGVIDYNVQKRWSDKMWLVSDAMEKLDADPQAMATAKMLLDEMNATYRSHAAGMRALGLELELRATADSAGDEAVTLFRELSTLNGDYAAAARAMLPGLDARLIDDERRRAAAADAKQLRGEWAAAFEAVFAHFTEDVMSGVLPPAGLGSARKLDGDIDGRGSYDALWRTLYDARFRLQRAGESVDADQNEAANWLDALLAHMLRLRADEAATLLARPPQRGLPRAFDAQDIRDKCFDLWLGLLERMETGDGPLWPIELKTAAALARIIGDNGAGDVRSQATRVQETLKQAENDLEVLQARLGVSRFQYDANWPGFLHHVTTADGEAIDDALHQASAKRLEVWQPTPVAEVANDPGRVERVLEGYRVRTLLSLRTAAMLPQRVRKYSEQLNLFAAELEGSSAHADGVLASLRDVEAYPARMDTLSGLLNRMNDALDGIRAAKLDSQDILKWANDNAVIMADVQQDLETRSTVLIRLANDINASTKKAKSAFGTNSPLAEIWLAHSVSQAAALEFEAALESINHARTINPENEALNLSTILLTKSVTDLSKLAEGGNGRNNRWETLQRLRKAIDAGDAGKSLAELSALKQLFPDWFSNFVLGKLAEQAEGLSSSSIIYNIDPTPADPGQHDSDPVGPGPKPAIPPNRITLPDPDAAPVPASTKKRKVSHDEFKEAKNAWGNALTNRNTAHNSEKVRKAVADTEKLLSHEMSRDQIKELLDQVDRALRYAYGDSSHLLDHDNNYGHLYILKLKLENARNNVSEVYHV